MTGEYRLVPVEILDRFPEINVNNYDHDDACALNEWGVEVVLASVSIPTAGNVVIAQEPKNSGAPVTLTYRNYRGEVAERTITPKRIWFGSTEWHLEPQWLLTAFDHEKQADRDFALKDFGAAIPAAPQPEPPADLVERANAFAVKWGRSDSFISTTRAVAAFAVEYAVGVTDKLKRCDQDRIYRGKLLKKVRRALYAINADDEGDRVYFESSNDADMLSELKATLENWHWDEIMREGSLPDLVANCRKANERAKAAEEGWKTALETIPRLRAAHKKALAEEREACAKVAEGWPCEACGDKYQTCGNGDFWDAGGIYEQGRLDAAAAIRARKGGENE